MRIFTITSLLLLAWSATGWAQNITVVHDLEFGNMVAGVPKVISKHDAGSAAEFHVSGIAGDEMAIDISLPRYLSDGTNNMQIVFRDTDCAMDSSATPDQSSPGYNDLDPWHPITYRLGTNGLTIWLGGMAVPGLIQKAGSYSAVIVVTVTPTGN